MLSGNKLRAGIYYPDIDISVPEQLSIYTTAHDMQIPFKVQPFTFVYNSEILEEVISVE
ncbi:MAG: hypothetical protein IGNPGNKH_00433 [Sodalis sp. Ffu]|nr:MAG: hypothetical protein IGNPGNKH_00433 [Sodalis sp. Ffu]